MYIFKRDLNYIHYIQCLTNVLKQIYVRFLTNYLKLNKLTAMVITKIMLYAII